MDMDQSCDKDRSTSCLSGNCNEEHCTKNGAIPIDSNGMKLVREEIESHGSRRKWWSKVYPSESPIGSLEPPSPSFSGEGAGVHFPVYMTRSTDTSSSNHRSSSSANGSPCRSDDDEAEGPTSSIFGPPNKYFSDSSDLDSSIVSSRDVFYSFFSMGSTVSDATSELNLHDHGDIDQVHRSSNGPFDHERIFTDVESTNSVKQLQRGSEKLSKPLNFETNSVIWLPPPPENVNDEMEGSLFTYDDDNDEVENSGDSYLPTADVDPLFPAKDLDSKEPLKALVLGHFKSLVSQLLLAENMESSEDRNVEEWLEIITALAWQAAKYIKPDTRRGGSMDPCDYLKIKCIASGSPGESKFVKGIVCTKNIKHKRMISQYKNARLLVLGGSLEYQRASSHMLSSVQTLLQQENDHLKTVVSKIEALRPNILLVEKTVSLCALELLFTKEISVVLNVKRSLLQKIARCTGASIIPSMDDIPLARLGHCELFHLEKVSEDHEPHNHKKPSKTLMFFEGCPRRVCCTIVLKGSTRDELKKVKHVMQYAVFAAYQLSLETSFLADEGARISDTALNPSNLVSETTAVYMKPAESESISCYTGEANFSSTDFGSSDHLFELGVEDSFSELGNRSHDYFSPPEPYQEYQDSYFHSDDDVASGKPGFHNESGKEQLNQEEGQKAQVEVSSPVEVDDDDTIISAEKCSASDSNSILVSFSSNCMVNGTACERARLIRVKFYGPSDKPLGRYLKEDLFDQSYLCKSCHEPAESHVMCYTHKNANLTIKVRHLPDVKLPGEQDGKIWMWQRCLKCELVDGVPPATRRVVMSDAAWGLSFGKFLELSFYNHVTGNRVAACGHSPQKECLRFFGFGSMVASFQYSLIDILSVHLPPAILEFDHPVDQSWIIGEEAYEVCSYGARDLDKSSKDLSLDLVYRDINMGSPSEHPNGMENSVDKRSLDRVPSAASMLSDCIDSAWSGVDPSLVEGESLDDPSVKRLMGTTRVYSLDSARKTDETAPNGLHLSSRHSFDASGDHISNLQRRFLQLSEKIDHCIVHENEPTSIIAHALGFKDYKDRISNSPEGISHGGLLEKLDSLVHHDDHRSFVSEDQNHHLHVSFDDESSSNGKVKYSVTCYFAREFDALRKICCQSETDFIRSLSRCRKWCAQGGKSNVYFAKSLDDRFIIKQVTKTELESFEVFGPDYFRYLTGSLTSQSPTCLAKILGIYQVGMKGTKEAKKMDLMIMENLFFKRNISKVYDLKGSVRSRYVSDPSGTNKVLLDMNLLETVGRNPIFVGSKAKRNLERAVWNDTSFLASVDVMDYSLLVGVDEERKELVMGIIDFMRQYTWDKHLETWVKASGILGGPKNASPTVISPKQYKKRFRKAMTSYFLTVPDHWT